MKLTSDEIARLDAALEQFEKNARPPKRLHWVISIVVLASAVACFVFLVYVAKLWWSMGGLTSDSPSSAEVQIPIKVEILMAATLAMMFFCVAELAKAVVISLVGTIAAWRRSPSNAALAKLLRAKWEEEKAAMEIADDLSA